MIYLLAFNGRAMVQKVRRWSVTAEARAQYQVNPCGIYGGRIGTGTGSF
jgi:hypothetical protein